MSEAVPSGCPFWPHVLQCYYEYLVTHLRRCLLHLDAPRSLLFAVFRFQLLSLAPGVGAGSGFSAAYEGAEYTGVATTNAPGGNIAQIGGWGQGFAEKKKNAWE